MTRILALETAGESCSVALLDDGEVEERFEAAQRRQTERVLPMVEALLADAGVGLKSLDAIAFGQGPGAFTGVRVAAAVTQGLAFAGDLPVVGVSTLAACALSARTVYPQAQWLLPVFDARMGQLYWGAYECAGELPVAVKADALLDPDALPELPPRDWYVVGSGAIYEDALRHAYDCQVVDADVQPRAAAVAKLALPRVEAGDVLSAEQAQPVYLRDRVIQGAVR